MKEVWDKKWGFLSGGFKKFGGSWFLGFKKGIVWKVEWGSKLGVNKFWSIEWGLSLGGIDR